MATPKKTAEGTWRVQMQISGPRLGEAGDHVGAVRAMNTSVGLWESSANRSDVLESAASDSLLVMEVTESQAQALQQWAASGFKSPDYPSDLPVGVLYTSGEVFEMIE